MVDSKRHDRIPVIFEDEHLLVVHKPPELHVHPTRLCADSETCVSLLQRGRAQALFPIHRLDRATSGLLVFGKKREAASALGRSLAAGNWEKSYRLIVRGWTSLSGEFDEPLAARHSDKQVSALTRYQRVECFEIPYQVDRYSAERYSLVNATPVTGRLHQLRKHFRKAAHPLVGDVKYGHGKHNAFFRLHAKSHGLLLWANSLSLVHPISGCLLHFSSSEHCPVHFANALNYLRLHNIDGKGPRRGTKETKLSAP